MPSGIWMRLSWACKVDLYEKVTQLKAQMVAVDRKDDFYAEKVPFQRTHS
jgi:hypothetical protein